ncbi:MAG: DNA-directed RNA polymerase subunit A' [Candidatus Aenigmarchaeota archaeon]|nr:DNA-directed RNA polymerase subunit A' [Candidatus Aenigmarchaeota archaeon]
MKIDMIEFGIFSPKHIKDMSAVKIEQPELYDADGFPIETGLCDPRLGVVDPGLRCRTCGGIIGQCLGHFGHLELTKPVVNPLYGKKIYHILMSVCRKCSRPLITDDEMADMKKPLTEIYKLKKKSCPHCGEKQKEISFSKPTSFREGKNEMNSEEIRQRLEKISDEDVASLKIKGGRPEWLVLTIIPVPPVTVRPSITLETGERSEDDLTHKLVDVVRINERLKKNLELGAPDFIIADIWELLQYHISTYMDNEISTLPAARHRSGRALRTLIQRLSKKDGRFRGYLSGKRVNFSARTVISPDPRISMAEVGVPLIIAKELTIPIKANKLNLAELRKVIQNGPNTHLGANYVTRPDGMKKKVTEENKKDVAKEIDIGYIIERHLKDGDIVVFNRQPSLHRMSMMSHKVRVMPHTRTFTLNLSVTTPYNADFDGDEMNLHVPQTEEAQVEAELLMSTENHIRSPRYGLPIISCKQDHISGIYLLTQHSTKFDKKTAAELLMAIGLSDKIDELGDEVTGKEIFSFLLPKELNIEYKASIYTRAKKTESYGIDDYVIIKKGQLKQGVIDENSLGEKKGALINIIEQMDKKTAREFIDRVSRLSLEMVTKYGFSMSVSDQDISDKAKKRIKEIVAEADDTAKKLIRDYHADRMKKKAGMSEKDVFEAEILRTVGNASKDANKVISTDLINPNNPVVIMARTGARGSYVNLTQMCGFVGQESLEGKRIYRGYTKRTTSHFPSEDLSLKSRGFVANSYKEGLGPIEFFFDAMNSRENLMDKSLHTRHSGYMERRLINAMQDLHVSYDRTVRDSHNNIVQFIAGEDGLDPSKTDEGKPLMKLLDQG